MAAEDRKELMEKRDQNKISNALNRRKEENDSQYVKLEGK